MDTTRGRDPAPLIWEILEAGHWTHIDCTKQRLSGTRGDACTKTERASITLRAARSSSTSYRRSSLKGIQMCICGGCCCKRGWQIGVEKERAWSATPNSPARPRRERPNGTGGTCAGGAGLKTGGWLYDEAVWTTTAALWPESGGDTARGVCPL